MSMSTSKQITEQLFPELGREPTDSALTTIERFIVWRDSVELKDFIDFERNGKLVAKWVADGIREKVEVFPKSHLSDNPWVKALYNELEDHLRENDVLPDLTPEAKAEAKKGTEDNPKTHDSSQRKAVCDENHLKALEEENMQLKARLAQLEEQANLAVNIYADLAEMGADFGK